jgi:hypothetical protein
MHGLLNKKKDGQISYEIRIITSGRIMVGIMNFCRYNKSYFLIPILIF